MTRVYLAGPITGLSYEEARNGWRKDFAALLHKKIEPLSPMRQEGHLAEIKNISSHGYENNPLSSSRGIIAKDCLDVDRADLVVFNFLGAQRVSIGSVWEMGYAKAKGKPLVLILKKAAHNPHDHLFITDTADFVCETIAEAAQITNALLTSGL